MPENQNNLDSSKEYIILEDGSIIPSDFDSTSIEDTFLCKDYRTRVVTLAEDRWENHIQTHADEQNFGKNEVKITVEKPKGVFNTEFPNRELFVRQFGYKSYLFVPVDYAGSDFNASGKVVTAYRKEDLPNPNRSSQLYPTGKKQYKNRKKP